MRQRRKLTELVLLGEKRLTSKVRYKNSTNVSRVDGAEISWIEETTVGAGPEHIG